MSNWLTGLAGCCCGECELLTEEFTRANNSSLGVNWTETDWAIVSNRAECSTDNANAITTVKATNRRVSMKGQLSVSTAGDEFRVIWNWLDDDNYRFVEFIPVGSGSCGTIKFYKKVAGAVSQVGDTRSFTAFSTATFYDFAVCYDGTKCDAYLVKNSDRTVHAETAAWGGHVPGRNAGMGTGNVAGAVKVERFTFFHHEDFNACPACELGFPCKVFSDNFTRANSTNIGCDIEEVAGDWSINSNRLEVSSAYAVARAAKAETPGPGQVVITAKVAAFTVGVASARMRVLADLVDENNYWFGEIYYDGVSTLGAGPRLEFSIGRRIAGVDTYYEVLNTFILTSRELVITSPDDDGIVSIKYGSYGMSRPDSGPWVNAYGVGTGPGTTTAQFELLEASRRNASECPHSPPSCVNCADGDQPQWMQLDLPISGNGPLGTDTSPAAGLYLLPRLHDTFPNDPGPGFPLQLFEVIDGSILRATPPVTSGGGGEWCQAYILRPAHAPELYSLAVYHFHATAGADMPATVCPPGTSAWFMGVQVDLYAPFGSTSHMCLYGVINTDSEDEPPDCTAFNVRCYRTMDTLWPGTVVLDHVDIQSVDPP